MQTSNLSACAIVTLPCPATTDIARPLILSYPHSTFSLFILSQFSNCQPFIIWLSIYILVRFSCVYARVMNRARYLEVCVGGPGTGSRAEL